MVVTKSFIEVLERSLLPLQSYINDLEHELPSLKGQSKIIVEEGIEQCYQDMYVLKGVIEREKTKEPLRGTA